MEPRMRISGVSQLGPARQPKMTGNGRLDDEFSVERSKHFKSLHGILQDTFYRLIPGEERTTADVNPAVIERIQQLHSHKDCTPFLHEFLDIILYEMLVVEDRSLISDIDIDIEIEKPTVQKRLKSTELVARLDSLIKQGEKARDPDNLFFTEGKPQSTMEMKLTSSVTVEQPIWWLKANQTAAWLGE
ncbi:hypothetical protein QBC43DRAFT_125768 [Cladorrhinum sp. PSN259]|nr:hypothetical protein QBC43DRAFT_125768 [Cladorrhinum sp. PSN259]